MVFFKYILRLCRKNQFFSIIYCIKIKSTKGHVDYRVHTLEDGWLAWVNSKTETGTESYAGIYGHTIDGIQMK